MIAFDTKSKNRLVLRSDYFGDVEEIAQQLIAEKRFGRVNECLRYRRIGNYLSDLSIFLRPMEEWNDRQD
jgi:hypothetical protein